MVATTTLLATALVLTAATAGASAYAAKSGADAQADAAKYNAKVATNAAQTAQLQAAFDAGQIRDKNRRLLGAQRAAFAASGIDPNSGTAMDVYQDTSTRGEWNALTAIYTGKVGANAQLAQATLDRMNASSAQRAGNIGIGTSLLGGATSATAIYANPNFRNNPQASGAGE